MGAGAVALSSSLGAVSVEGSERDGVRASPLIRPGGRSPEVVVLGAGAFGGWAAYHLQGMGARVTLVDLYGPGNSRSTSGDETRGVRTSYANRDQWCSWASRSIERWKSYDEEWAHLGEPLFFTTGDLLLRPEWNEQLELVRQTLERNGVAYERLDGDELRRRWPQIDTEPFDAALYEVEAGVVRSRAACLRVAHAFQERGGVLRVGRAEVGDRMGSRLLNVEMEGGGGITADLFVFALGPWLPKVFPEVMGQRIRIQTMGHVFYFGTPPGDDRFGFPNLPSFGVAGYTGWPTLPVDNRGLRIRTGGSQADDPDTSVRWVPEPSVERARAVVAERFPAMAGQPLLETRACHYESSVTRDWFIDRHPEYENVWIAGGGSAEGFKFGPMVGELIADRALGRDLFPEVNDLFRIRDSDLAMAPPPATTEFGHFGEGVAEAWG